MARNGMGAGGVFFIGYSIIVIFVLGIDWLVDGHISRGLAWWLLSIYVGVFLAGLHERLDSIRDDSKEIKEHTEELLKRMTAMGKSLEDVERKIRFMD